jgi:hypothetical protein
MTKLLALTFLMASLSCSDKAADVVSAPKPLLLSSSPALAETNVYPAPLWLGKGEEVAIQLEFSEPMVPAGDLTLVAADHQRAVSESVWSEEGRLLTLLFRGDFASARPLADEREYALDLSPLISASGALLDPDAGLRERRLVFTTGRYDALLNHSCGHTFFGPFASIAAGGTNDASAPDISVTHTEYAVTARAFDGGYGGFLRARFPTPGPYRLYFDGAASVTLVKDDHEDALELTATARACPGISYEVDLTPAADEEVFLRLGPDAAAKRRLIVELVPQQ